MHKADTSQRFLQPLPTAIPLNGEPGTNDHVKHLSIITRRGYGSAGRSIPLLANLFKVSFKHPDEIFYHYNVSIASEERSTIGTKGISRTILDKLYQIYSADFVCKRFAYDGENSLYTLEPFPDKKNEFLVVLDSSLVKRGSNYENGSLCESAKKARHSMQSRTFKVVISYAASIPLRSVTHTIQGAEPEKLRHALGVLNTILRQHAANRGCLLLKQSFFCDDSRNFIDIGGGVVGCRGFHSSFLPTHGGLSLNMDVSTTLILKPGPVVGFLKASQNAQDVQSIDWTRAKRMLKGMRIKTTHNNKEYKIKGLSEKPCNQLFFPLRVIGNDGRKTEGGTVDITVFEYFTNQCNIELTCSASFPCVDVGRPKVPIYLPLEVCHLVSLQRYTKALSSQQRASLIEKFMQKPQEKIKAVNDAIRNCRYHDDPLLVTCGISIEKRLTQFDGRVLEAPKLKVGNGKDCLPVNGRWNYNEKTFFAPTKIDRWAVVSFSARCHLSSLSQDLINCAKKKGMHIEPPYSIIEEDLRHQRSDPVIRVEKMSEKIKAALPGPPQLILCVLPDKRSSDIYGPWKKKCLCDLGFPTQCASPTQINDSYLTSLLLKINSKLGGVNHVLSIDQTHRMPLINEIPTMIVGMDVSHGSPGQDIPSFAAVVGSLYWPQIARFRASVRTQPSKAEMIGCLYKQLPDGKDDGIMRELFIDFRRTSNCKPKQIIVFRDGVGESQFKEVLNVEVDQMIQAYQHLEEYSLSCEIPKFTVIVCQKRHHTKLFQANGSVQNVPPGTVVDRDIVHPNRYDFYLCAHAGVIGTTRPAHYHVLIDEIGFSPDAMQSLVHSLSYVNQRCATAVSIVAPICYAHLAAKQVGQFLKFDDHSDISSRDGSFTASVPDLPRLRSKVAGSMFFI